MAAGKPARIIAHVLDVRGPKRFENDANEGSRMYTHEQIAQNAKFMAGSTVYVDSTAKDGQGVPLDPPDVAAQGLANRVVWSLSVNGSEPEIQDLRDEACSIDSAGFKVGLHCDEEGQYLVRAELPGVGAAEVRFEIA